MYSHLNLKKFLQQEFNNNKVKNYKAKILKKSKVKEKNKLGITWLKSTISFKI